MLANFRIETQIPNPPGKPCRPWPCLPARHCGLLSLLLAPPAAWAYLRSSALSHSTRPPEYELPGKSLPLSNSCLDPCPSLNQAPVLTSWNTFFFPSTALGHGPSLDIGLRNCVFRVSSSGYTVSSWKTEALVLFTV